MPAASTEHEIGEIGPETRDHLFGDAQRGTPSHLRKGVAMTRGSGIIAGMNRVAQIQGMDRATWERHANPWSFWTRLPILPLLTLALWSRVWIGWWALVPICLLLIWTWVNPRAFGVPESTRSWASRAVMGERVWLNAAEVPIPTHHARAARLLSALGLLGIIPWIWGVFALDPWAAGLGVVLVLVIKLWFLDRMVWLYTDMAKTHATYADWLR